MDIAAKLKLYSAQEAGHQAKPSGPSLESTAQDLAFGSFVFKEDKKAFPGLWLHKRSITEFSLGEKKLREYLPLGLSPILELALLPNCKDLILHPEEILFLDTETTGLSRGTGNFPFLIGLAYFKKEKLILEQLYLDSPSQAKEEALWNYFTNMWQNFSYLVSYNGSSFDLPVIQNRLRLNRKTELRPLLHFDLLHIFRRLFPQGSLPGYRQQDLEKEILKYFRQGDVEGAEIPQIYFDYLKYSYDRGMEKIIEHNQLDLVGMLFLFMEAIRAYEQKDQTRGALRSGLARILAKNRRTGEALDLLRDLEFPSKKEEDDFVSHLRYRDLLLLAQLYRREAKLENCARIYQKLVREYQCVYSQMALAKLWEHRFKNYQAAIECVQDLRAKLDTSTTPRPQSRLYTHAELKHRLQRLRNKYRRQMEKS